MQQIDEILRQFFVNVAAFLWIGMLTLFPLAVLLYLLRLVRKNYVEKSLEEALPRALAGLAVREAIRSAVNEALKNGPTSA
jgi:hypothetical protein